MKKTYGILIWLLVAPSLTLVAQRRVRLSPVLQEISGLVCTPDGSLWALNDGGNNADLYRIDRHSGQILETRHLPLPNRDWEDLAADPAGNLYLADVGNNGNRRHDLRIYRYSVATGAIDSILFRYPQQQAFPPADRSQWFFDCEAVVWWNDTLHLFTKSRFVSDHRVYHYAVPVRPGQYEAELLDSIRLRNRVVSGAGLSHDGRQLALTSYIVGKKWGFWPYTKASVYWFEKSADSRWLSQSRKRRRLPKFLIARQFESVAQLPDGRWIAANEGIWVQKPGLWRIKR